MTAPRPTIRYPARTKAVVVAVLAAAIAVFTLAVLAADTDGEDPVAVSGGTAGDDQRGVLSRSPRDGAQVLAQEPFSVRLAPGWTGELTFIPGNGAALPLPEDEIEVTALNELVYVPDDGKALERLPEGTTSCVRATVWDRVEGREATEVTETWCFSVT